VTYPKITGFAAILVAGVSFAAAGEPAQPKGVACVGGAMEATVVLAYDRVTIGDISATYLNVGFDGPLALPQQPQKLRARLTGIQPATTLGPPSVETKRLRVALLTSERGFGPGPALKVRFDCPAGSRVASSGFTCVTSEVANAAGEPLAENLARDVRCLVELDPRAR
jgi:hypothetical protein